MVHVRRKFFEEAERTGAAIAKEAVKRIGTLYNVEKEAKGKSPEEWVALRQAKAKPFDDFWRATRVCWHLSGSDDRGAEVSVCGVACFCLVV